MKRWLALTFFLLALPAQAEVYKCRQPGGSIEFSNLPCTGGSSTVKAVADDVIPEEKRRKAERNVEQMREDAEKMEANRRAGAEREHQENQEQQQRMPSAPSASAIEECLLNVERMALDHSRRAELEANCRASGATTQPVYVPVPYYGGPSYIKPHLPQVNPRPQPRGEADPLPAPPQSRAAGKINPEYAPPSGFKAR